MLNSCTYLDHAFPHWFNKQVLGTRGYMPFIRLVQNELCLLPLHLMSKITKLLLHQPNTILQCKSKVAHVPVCVCMCMCVGGACVCTYKYKSMLVQLWNNQREFSRPFKSQGSEFPLQTGNQNKSELPELQMCRVGGSNVVKNSSHYLVFLFPKECVLRKRKH